MKRADSANGSSPLRTKSRTRKNHFRTIGAHGEEDGERNAWSAHGSKRSRCSPGASVIGSPSGYLSIVPFVRPLDDLVVDVGEVPAVGYVEAGVGEDALEDVERDVDARVANVRIVVHGDTADVHREASAHVGPRRDDLLGLGERVVEGDGGGRGRCGGRSAGWGEAERGEPASEGKGRGGWAPAGGRTKRRNTWSD